ncbi:MAG: AAA family ATPase [Spirochaetales bacterium]|jgi:predicted ATP-dependent protease|nr:AAA family ATPase [Spirochaetales bacterium]
MELHDCKLAPEAAAFGIRDEEIAALDTGTPGPPPIIGQERALRALALGTRLRAKGYNIYAAGLPGTGKRTAITRIVQEYQPEAGSLTDLVYVNNFERPDSPILLSFPAGKGAAFKKALQKLVENLRNVLPGLLTETEYKNKKTLLVGSQENGENQRLTELETRLAREGFRIIQTGNEGANSETEGSSDLAPLYRGRPTSFDELQRLLGAGKITEAFWNETREKYYRSMDELGELFAAFRRERLRVEEEIRRLGGEAVGRGLRAETQEIQREFPGGKTGDYLSSLEADVAKNLHLFTEEPQEKDEPPALRYGANLIVDNSSPCAEGRVPVIFETSPDYASLFGTQESFAEVPGEVRTHFMMLRAGSLIRASGGFLVLRAEDILSEEDAWTSLKRALENGVTEIRNPPNPFYAPPSALKPEPVKIDTKIILTGNENTYDWLYAGDEDFPKLFKVPAEFDSLMERDERGLKEYITFIRGLSAQENLKTFDHSAIAAVIEYAVKVGEFRSKLTTRFSLIADLIREASHWARVEAKETVDRAAVRRALGERRFLHNLPECKIDEQILSGEILMTLTGSAVGRINGLAVLDRGYYAFGRPLVITARTAPGHDGIINIERESGLSGEIHDKGVLIIEGYLQALYARDFPLSIKASICFEQSYIEVDGDSASSAEIYVLLSAIAALPLRQDIAVTGSVNQMGDIQPVGGVSEKIEGFYEVCRKTGLTGEQGVIIPRLNIPNLILSPEVQKSLTEGDFHLYAVSTVDEGIEILTGLPAGRQSPKSGFPAHTVNGKVEQRLREMAELVKDFGGN